MTVKISLVATRSLIPIGTPASGPGSSPAAILASTTVAAARATSGVGVQNAWMCDSSFSMRRRTASATSTADSVLFLTRAATETASMRQISLSVLMYFLQLAKERSGRRRNGLGRRHEAEASPWRRDRRFWGSGRRSGKHSSRDRSGSSGCRGAADALLTAALDRGSRRPTLAHKGGGAQ